MYKLRKIIYYNKTYFKTNKLFKNIHVKYNPFNKDYNIYRNNMNNK